MDPDMNGATLGKLQQSEAPVIRNWMATKKVDRKIIRSMLESDYVAENLLGLCLGEYPEASMADLVARYCECRNEPFIFCAITLKRKLQREGCFTYVRQNRTTGDFIHRKWVPINDISGIDNVEWQDVGLFWSQLVPILDGDAETMPSENPASGSNYVPLPI